MCSQRHSSVSYSFTQHLASGASAPPSGSRFSGHWQGGRAFGCVTTAQCNGCVGDSTYSSFGSIARAREACLRMFEMHDLTSLRKAQCCVAWLRSTALFVMPVGCWVGRAQHHVSAWLLFVQVAMLRCLVANQCALHSTAQSLSSLCAETVNESLVRSPFAVMDCRL